MYKIKKKDPARTLPELAISKEVFHEAQKLGLSSCRISDNGYSFDMEYIENETRTPANIKNNIPPGLKLIPDYLEYNENDSEDLSLGILTWARRIVFETLDEYTVVAGRLALERTDCQVYFTDAGILAFIEPDERLHICATVPEFEDDRTLFVQDEFKYGYFELNWHRLDSASLFHNIFFWQSIETIPRDAIRYVRMTPHPLLGIGGVLEQVTLLNNIITPKGWRIQYEATPGSICSVDFLEHYFDFDVSHPDSDRTNTIDLNFLFFSTAVCKYTSSTLSVDSFKPAFLEGIEMYREAVIGDKKTLGVLIRGTDYFSSQWHANQRKMSGTSEIIPLIRQWMKDYDYELVFLATEDQDILDEMWEEFGTQMRAISQVRFRKSDFATNQIIADKINKSKDKTSLAEDTTVNYFYALYILSRCEGFICSGVCNGWTLVNQFNKGKFENVKLFNAI